MMFQNLCVNKRNNVANDYKSYRLTERIQFVAYTDKQITGTKFVRFDSNCLLR